MRNEGERLNLVFGKRIKGEGGKDKRKVLGKRERNGDFWGLLDWRILERLEKGEETRGKRKERRRRGSKNPS